MSIPENSANGESFPSPIVAFDPDGDNVSFSLGTSCNSPSLHVLLLHRLEVEAIRV